MTVPNGANTVHWPHIRAALCHDWLTGMRGGERVLEMLCEGFPDAPVYTLLANRDAISDTIRSHPIHTSWLQHIPGIEHRYRMLLPLFPSAINALRPPPDTELVISTSHCVAKSLQTAPETRHLCYCFTPMRYAWALKDDYIGHGIKALMASPVLATLRQWDRSTAKRVDRFVAISHHVRRRIERYYGRKADVVYPPVDTQRCTPGPRSENEDFDLVVSALVPYKRIDLAVEAYNRLGRRLVIVGVGSKRNELEARANDNIHFMGWQDDTTVLSLYRQCRLLVFPGEEDFGIVPLEAQACGKPVVAFKKGGALETIKEGVSGLFFEEQSCEALAEAVTRAEQQSWDLASIRQHAEAFRPDVFIEGLSTSIRTCLQQPSSTMKSQDNPPDVSSELH